MTKQWWTGWGYHCLGLKGVLIGVRGRWGGGKARV